MATANYLIQSVERPELYVVGRSFSVDGVKQVCTFTNDVTKATAYTSQLLAQSEITAIKQAKVEGTFVVIPHPNPSIAKGTIK